MKKQLLLGILAIASLGLAGCGNASSSSPADSTSTGPQVSSDLSITSTGDAKVGETITLVAKYQNSPIVDQSAVTYTVSPADSMTITGNKAELLKSGDATITGVYTTDTLSISNTLTITIEEGVLVSTIATVKANATETAAPVRVRGVVTATYGKGGYIDDGTDAILIYNWYSTTTDTAITKQSDGQYGLTLGDTVEIYAYVYTYYGMAELSKSYKSGDDYVDLTDAYCIKYTGSTITPTSVKSVGETEIKALTTDKSGLFYSFDATYVSGTPTVGAKTYINFTVGSTAITLITDKKEVHAKLTDDWATLGLVAGDKVHIVAPFNELYESKNQLDFSYFSYGTVITKKDLSISATDNHYVGQTVTLSGVFAGEAATGTTYEITAGSDFATLTGSSLAIIGVGDITIKGTYVKDSVTYTKSVTIKSRDLSAVSTVTAAKALADGEYVTVEGKIVSNDGKFKFVVADATGGMFGYVGDSTASDTGLDTDGYIITDSIVKVTGVISTYNGVKEITMKHETAGTIPVIIESSTAEVTPLATETIADETAFKSKISSTSALTNGGNMYAVTAKFKSVSSSTATFTIGTTNFYVYYPSSDAATNANLVADSSYTITAAYMIYSSKAEFMLYTHGTSVVAA